MSAVDVRSMIASFPPWRIGFAIASFYILYALVWGLFRWNNKLPDFFQTHLGYAIIALPMMVAPPFIIFRLSKFEDLGKFLPFGSERRGFFIGVGAISGALLGVALTAVLAGMLRNEFRILAQFSLLTPLFVISAALEELVFRGYLFARFRENYNSVRSIVATSFLFSLAHVNFDRPMFGMILLGFVGIVLGFLRDESGSILPPVAAHSAYNLIAVTS